MKSHKAISLGSYALLILSMASAADAVPTCPNNDFKACDEALKKTHTKDQGKEFVAVFNQICSMNSKFKCVKMTVMGDFATQMKEVKAERSKGASFFEVNLDDGKYLYIFERKPAASK